MGQVSFSRLDGDKRFICDLLCRLGVKRSMGLNGSTGFNELGVDNRLLNNHNDVAFSTIVEEKLCCIAKQVLTHHW